MIRVDSFLDKPVCDLHGLCLVRKLHLICQKCKSVYIESINLGPAITLFICFAFCFSELQRTLLRSWFKIKHAFTFFSQCHFFLLHYSVDCVMVKTVYDGGIWEMIFIMVEISWTILAKRWCCQHIETWLWADFADQIQLNVLVMQFSVSLSIFFYRSCCIILFSC